mmetsp:Transcript_7864/g.19344  ORF Transcript_7864/g.19344 Transcript_7864/m.19344 type:complete len:95 (+) Transcript_7864:2061-2345(+)
MQRSHQPINQNRNTRLPSGVLCHAPRQPLPGLSIPANEKDLISSPPSHLISSLLVHTHHMETHMYAWPGALREKDQAQRERERERESRAWTTSH